MGDIHNAADRTNRAANSSLNTIVSIEQRLVDLSGQADHIAKGFAFFSTIPELLSRLIRGTIATVGILFIFSVLCKLNRRLATYAAGACSSAYLFHICGLYQWLGSLPTHAAKVQDHTLITMAANLSPSQKAAGLMTLLWLGAYPVGCINVYLGSIIGNAINKLLGSYWIRQYSNDGGMGILPSIEIPAPISRSPLKVIPHNTGFVDMDTFIYSDTTTVADHA
jgi:hypothetical protein